MFGTVVWLKKWKKRAQSFFILFAILHIAFFSPFAFASSANVTQLVFTTLPQTLNVDMPSSFTVELRDGSGQPEQLDQAASLHLSSTSITGQFAEEVNDVWQSLPSIPFPAGQSDVSFLYKDATPATAAISVRLTGGGLVNDMNAMQSVTVVVPAPVNGMPHQTFQNSHTTDFSWNSIASATGYEFRMSQDNAALATTTPTFSAASSYHEESMPDGTWYWQVRAMDGGWKSDWSDTWRFTIDTTPPAISTSVQDQQSVNGTVSLDISITDANPSVYDVRVQLPDGTFVTEGHQTNDPNTTYTYAWDTTGIANGTYTIMLSATDAAGNVAVPLARTLTVANAPPLPALPVVAISGSDGLAVNGEVNYSQATFAVTIDGVLRPDVMPTVGAEQSDGLFAWTFELPKDVQDGLSHAIAIAAHANGQSSETVYSTIVTQDTKVIVPAKDPLLEQLSASLSRPFTLPSITSLAPIVTSNSQISGRNIDIPTVNQPDVFVATPTENGWKVLGILWYWWVLVACVVGAGVYVFRRYKYTAYSSTLDT